eukprot:12407939-Karenia_brevis.AAC.1
MKEVRREWVRQHGLAVAIPMAMWPRRPDGQLADWCPPRAWLTEEPMQSSQSLLPTLSAPPPPPSSSLSSSSSSSATSSSQSTSS